MSNNQPNTMTQPEPLQPGQKAWLEENERKADLKFREAFYGSETERFALGRRGAFQLILNTWGTAESTVSEPVSAKESEITGQTIQKLQGVISAKNIEIGHIAKAPFRRNQKECLPQPSRGGDVTSNLYMDLVIFVAGS